MTEKQNVIVKSVSIMMLLIAALELPYDYYVFLRWIICGSSGYFAYIYFQDGFRKVGYVFLGIAIIFNPIAPFYLNKSTWIIIDIIVAGMFLISIFVRKKKNKVI